MRINFSRLSGGSPEKGERDPYPRNVYYGGFIRWKTLQVAAAGPAYQPQRRARARAGLQVRGRRARGKAPALTGERY